MDNSGFSVLWLIAVVGGPIVLGAVLAVGALRSRKRSQKGTEATPK